MQSSYLDNLSDEDLNALVDTLCSARDNNPDVVLLDNIKQEQSHIDPFIQEKMNEEYEKEIIQNDIIKSIFESSTPMTQEEMNELKAKGIYNKYIRNNRNYNPYEEEDAMQSVEEEIMRTMNEETVEEVIDIPEEEVINDDSSFQEPEETIIDETSDDISESQNSSNTKEDLREVLKNESESLHEVTEEFNKTLKDIASGKAIEEMIKTTEDNSDDEEYKPMSVEEMNDVPATKLNVDESLLTSAITKEYSDVSTEDAMELIKVMNRYKAGEKFKVFDALPESLRNIISKEAMESGAGSKSIMEFFAKNFINGLVSDTYIDKEIKDFNEEMKQVTEPMKNIAGSVMDEYSDEIYNKYTVEMEKKAEELKETNPEKAKQLLTIADNYKKAFNFDRVKTLIERQSNINWAYKEARDHWSKLCDKYKEAVSKVTPTPRDISQCLMTLSTLGYPEQYTKTFIVLLAKTITDAIEVGTVEEHIYAYYASNAIYTIAFTANSSKVNKIVDESITNIMNKINDYMVPLTSRNTKKNKKRNKYTRSLAEVYISGLKDPSYPIKEYHGIIEK